MKASRLGGLKAAFYNQKVLTFRFLRFIVKVTKQDLLWLLLLLLFCLSET